VRKKEKLTDFLKVEAQSPGDEQGLVEREAENRLLEG